MKKTIIAALILILAAQCTPPGPEEAANAEQQPATLTILVYDLSKSSTHIDLSLAEWRKAWMDDALHGGCQLAAMKITRSSARQKPLITNLVEIDTMPVAGTIYRKNAILKENKAKLEKAKLVFDNWENRFKEEVFLPKNETRSDVNGALQLAQQLATAYQAKGYLIRLLILSDLLHDLSNNSTLQTIKLPKGTEVVVIGGAIEVPYEQLFPGANLILSPVFRADLLIHS